MGRLDSIDRAASSLQKGQHPTVAAAEHQRPQCNAAANARASARVGGGGGLLCELDCVDRDVSHHLVVVGLEALGELDPSVQRHHPPEPCCGGWRLKKGSGTVKDKAGTKGSGTVKDKAVKDKAVEDQGQSIT